MKKKSRVPKSMYEDTLFDIPIKHFRKEYYLTNIRLYESYIKTLITMVLSIGIGLFLILVFFGIVALSESYYSYVIPIFYFYCAMFVLLFTGFFVYRLHIRLKLRINEMFINAELKEKYWNERSTNK